MAHHERYLEKYILSQTKFDRKQKKAFNRNNNNNNNNDDDEKDYDELTLVELSIDSDNYQTVKYQFLDSAKYQMCDIERLCIYRVVHKHRNDAYIVEK